jgi:hypothetical protein
MYDLPRPAASAASRDRGSRGPAVGTSAGSVAEEESAAVEVGVGDGKEPAPEVRHLDREDFLIIAVGLAVAGMAFFIGLIRQTFLTFTILVHEMGHTIFGWLFG